MLELIICMKLSTVLRTKEGYLSFSKMRLMFSSKQVRKIVYECESDK